MTQATTKLLRNVDGILLLDKSLQYSSNQALQRVKRLFQAKKAGHTGSLDPMATGMLPICFGNATKFAQYLLSADKGYETAIKLGVTTTTADAEGEIVATKDVPVISDLELQRVLATFTGTISQTPPMYSAVKIQGQPLYKLARQGITIDREPRQVTIHELVLMKRTQDVLHLRIRCSKGTYIRTLAQDIGDVFGCGGSISELRRVFVSPYENGEMLTFDRLEQISKERGPAALDGYVLPVESALAHWPSVTISTADRFYLRMGKSLKMGPEIVDGWVRLTLADKFIGLAEIVENQLFPRKMLTN